MTSPDCIDCIGERVMWNTGAADATGTIVALNGSDADVRRDADQHNGGVVYRLFLPHLWAITDPPYRQRMAEVHVVAPGQEQT